MALDHKRRLFVQEYLVDLVKSKAAERAGFPPTQGARLTREPEVAAAIERGMARREQSIAVTAERVLDQIGALAFSDLRKVFKEDGSLLPPDQWPDDVAPAISSIEVDELFEWQPRDDGGRGKQKVQIGVTKKLKLWDKPAALTMLGKHFRLWTEQVEVKVENMTDEERLLRAESIITAGLARAREQALLAQSNVPDDAEDLVG